MQNKINTAIKLIFNKLVPSFLLPKWGNGQNYAKFVVVKSILIGMKKFVLYFSLIMILVLGSLVYWKYFFTYSEGYRAGLLQKFSLKGNIFKTYEGEMILSSIQSNSNVAIASEKFFFSVTDKSVALKLEKVQGESIVVHYREKNGTFPWNGESYYFVDSVRVTNSEGTSRGFR